MEELITWLASDNGFAVHAGVFILLVLGGLGFPVPEDVPLLLGGVAIAKEITPLSSMFLVAYAGVVLGDQTIYLIGYLYGQKLLKAGTKWKFMPKLTEERLEEVREGLRKRRLLYIFVSRHLFPIRSATFVSAGALRVPFLEFLLADAIAALVSVSIMLGIGYWLGDKLTIETVEHFVEESHNYVFAIVAVSGLFLFWRHHRNKKKRANLQKTVEQQSN